MSELSAWEQTLWNQNISLRVPNPIISFMQMDGYRIQNNAQTP